MKSSLNKLIKPFEHNMSPSWCGLCISSEAINFIVKFMNMQSYYGFLKS